MRLTDRKAEMFDHSAIDGHYRARTRTTDGQTVWHRFQDTSVPRVPIKGCGLDFSIRNIPSTWKRIHFVTDTWIKRDRTCVEFVLTRLSFYNQYLTFILMSLLLSFLFSKCSNIKMNDTFFRNKRPGEYFCPLYYSQSEVGPLSRPLYLRKNIGQFIRMSKGTFVMELEVIIVAIDRFACDDHRVCSSHS